jgi:ABC-type iron transport system FetAB ATPase subunit
VVTGAMAEHATSQSPRFALAKFRPTIMPATLVARPVLQERLTAGAGQRLTVVIGSAGSGKSVLLSSWAAARPPGATSWLSCDEADADPRLYREGSNAAFPVPEGPGLLGCGPGVAALLVPWGTRRSVEGGGI